MPDLLIIGAGVSGLAVAEWLRGELEVELIEAAAEPGGKVQSETLQGFTFDKAANGWLDNEPAMERLLLRAGLSQQLLKAPGGARYIALGGEMVALPGTPQGMLTSPVLSWGAKLRMVWELLAPGFEGEETVAQFVRRRLGPEALERLVQPMVSGIYAGDVENLSVEGCFPKLKEIEREHGSLIIGMHARKSKTAGPSGVLTSLRGGAAVLPQTLARRQRVHYQRAATAIERQGQDWLVHTAQGSLRAPALVLAAPAHVAGPLLQGVDVELSQRLQSIPYAPVAVVCQGLPKDGWTPPQGFGVLIPDSEKMGILGTLFTSSIFPEHAPQDGVAIRTILGGAMHPTQARLEPDALVEIARRDNAKLFGCELPPARVTRVYQHARAIPQYTLGHPQRVAGIREAAARHPGLFVTGNHLRGIGVKDCARAGEHTAQSVRAYLQGPKG